MTTVGLVPRLSAYTTNNGKLGRAVNCESRNVGMRNGSKMYACAYIVKAHRFKR